MNSAACVVFGRHRVSSSGMTTARDSVTSTPITYLARQIVPIDGPPLDDGCLVVADGKIAVIGPRRVAEGRVVDLGDVVVLPGFVNAHCHLEFSRLTKPLGTRGMEFTDWLREVIAYRREGPFEPESAVVAGLQESLAAGVTTIGEITTAAPRQLFDRPPSHGPLITAFVELLGLADSRVPAQLDRLRDVVLGYPKSQNVRIGVSPHAPYTVNPKLLETAVRTSSAERVPLAFHLAESPAEMELLRDGAGAFVELLAKVGAWDSSVIPRGTRPLDYLRTLSHAERSLVIHGNYLDDEEIKFLASHAERMTTIYCPRTHAYFGHPPHPLEKLLAAGAAVAVGTDGRCTNPDLDLRTELQFIVRTYPSLRPERIVRLGTIDGARALGLDREVGSLAVGKRADFVALRVPAFDDVYAALLEDAAIVTRTVVGGHAAVALDD